MRTDHRERTSADWTAAASRSRRRPPSAPHSVLADKRPGPATTGGAAVALRKKPRPFSIPDVSMSCPTRTIFAFVDLRPQAIPRYDPATVQGAPAFPHVGSGWPEVL